MDLKPDVSSWGECEETEVCGERGPQPHFQARHSTEEKSQGRSKSMRKWSKDWKNSQTSQIRLCTGKTQLQINYLN